MTEGQNQTELILSLWRWFELPQQAFGKVNLAAAPNWRINPVSLITMATQQVTRTGLRIDHSPDHLAQYDREIQRMVDLYLKPIEVAGKFFDGEYANVLGITVQPELLSIQTGVARAFPYLASAWHYRNNPGETSIRPLAVQTVISDAEKHDTLLVERRPADITDHPNKLSVLGGALRPGEDPFIGASRCLAKWGITMNPSQLTLRALTHEPVDMIYCLVFTAEMPGRQIDEVIRKHAEKSELWQEPIASYHATRLSLLTKTNIHDWNPLGFLAFTCAAFIRHGRGEEEVREFLDTVYWELQTHPYTYNFPMQKYLPTEPGNT